MSGAPEALRLADLLRLQVAYHREVASDCDMRAENTINWGHGEVCCSAADELRRLHAENELLAALVEAQQPATHVQNPAGIEHVAGDVSKNGVESNMAQQPAPSAAVALSDDLRDGLVAISAAIADQDDRAAQAMLREILAAPQPSPTPQADSQPAPVGGAAELLKEILAAACCEESETNLTSDQYRKLYDLHSSIQAISTPPTNAADSVTAPAGGAVSAPVFAFRRKGLDDFCTCTEERYAELSAKPNLFETRIFYTAPPAQAADSVLEDAELGRIAMRFVDRAGDPHPGIDDAETICREFHAAMSAVLDPRFQRRMDAARKKGANHD